MAAVRIYKCIMGFNFSHNVLENVRMSQLSSYMFSSKPITINIFLSSILQKSEGKNPLIKSKIRATQEFWATENGQ